jgi:hypothetical protein
MKDRLDRIRKWVADHVLVPALYWVMPSDGWNHDYLILQTGYFWVVMARQYSVLAHEHPGSYHVVALQCGHENVAQTWEFDQMTGHDVQDLITKLRKTQGVNNVCFLNSDADFSHIRGTLDKVLSK